MDFCKAKDFDFNAATAEGCYAYLDCDVVIINKYVPSRLETASICLAQDELPGGGIAVYFEKEYFGTLAMRLPEDKTLVPDAFINGDAYCYAVSGTGDEPRYALIAGPFEKGCKIRLDLPKLTHVDSLECSVPENEPIIVEDAVSVGEDSVPANEHSVPAVEDSVPAGEHSVPVAEVSVPAGDSVENFASESILTEDQSLQIQIETSEDCCILYNDQKSRYLLRLNSYDDTVTFSLSEGYAVAVGDDSLYTGLITFIFRGEQFLGETFKIVNTRANTYRIFDFVVMQAVSDDISVSLTNAYSPIVGAFSGEACYIIDNSAKTSNSFDNRVEIGHTRDILSEVRRTLDNSNSASSIAESATHGSKHKASRLGFDAITGYKWGKQDNSETTYLFELENGNYEISASFSAPGSSLAACTVPERERVLFAETTTETSCIPVRITNGFLQLIIRGGNADFTALIIRAIDTIASDSGYVQIYPEPAELADEFDDDVELNLPTLEDCEEGELILPTLEDCKEDELILPTPEDCEENEADLPKLEGSEEGVDSPVPENPEEGEINIPVLEDDSEDCTERKLSLSTLEDGKVNVCDLSTADENKFDKSDHAALSNSKKDESGPRITVVSSNHSTAKNLPTGLKNLSPAGRKHVNTTLAAKKSKDTAKKLGVAAGALALAGSIVALFKKDN